MCYSRYNHGHIAATDGLRSLTDCHSSCEFAFSDINQEAICDAYRYQHSGANVNSYTNIHGNSYCDGNALRHFDSDYYINRYSYSDKHVN